MGCNYRHKVWCTKHPLWDVLLAEWSLIKEYCSFPTVEASLSCLSWPWQSYILLSRHIPLPFFGCISIPDAQFSPVLYLYNVNTRCSCVAYRRRYIQSWQYPDCGGVCEESTWFLLHFSPKARHRADGAATMPGAWFSTPFHRSWSCNGNQWSHTAGKLAKQRLALTPWGGFSPLVGETVLVRTFVNLVRFMSIKSIAFDFKGG